MPVLPSQRPPRRALCAGLLCSILLGACGGDTPRREPPVRAIKWTRVSEQSATQERRVAGTVKPVRESRLSFEVGGRVRRVRASLGSRVRAGDVLAELDPRPFELALRRAEAEQKGAEAIRHQQHAELRRYERMMEAAAVSRADFDRVRASFESAHSETRARAAQVGLAQRDLEHAALRAPFDGVISMKRIDPYVEVRPGEVLFELDSEEGYEVKIAAPEAVVLHVATGHPATIHFPSLAGLATPGRIKEIGPRAGIADAFPMKLVIDGPVKGLRPGITAEAEFRYREVHAEMPARTIQVPFSALLAKAGDRYAVFAYDDEAGTVRETPVVLRDLRGNAAQIAKGLSSGQIIATAGVEFLSDGQPVTLLGSDPS